MHILLLTRELDKYSCQRINISDIRYRTYGSGDGSGNLNGKGF